MYEKPEVLKVGTKVEILESARDIGNYEDRDELLIGKTVSIMNVSDKRGGIYYVFEAHCFPHYCVRPVEKEEDIITVDGKKYKLTED